MTVGGPPQGRSKDHHQCLNTSSGSPDGDNAVVIRCERKRCGRPRGCGATENLAELGRNPHPRRKLSKSVLRTGRGFSMQSMAPISSARIVASVPRLVSVETITTAWDEAA